MQQAPRPAFLPFMALSTLLLLLGPFTTPSVGQCSPAWHAGNHFRGVEYWINALLPYDPDGPGPMPEEVIVGGNFTFAGNIQTTHIARWNGTTWFPMGLGLSGEVHALAQHPGGDLIVAGGFMASGGVSANRIARWNGAEWNAFGGGLWGTATCVAILPNGDIVAGGEFTHAEGMVVNHIARWDGTAWRALLQGLNGPVDSVAVMPNGDVIAAGQFTFAGATPVNRIGRWNGTHWSALGLGLEALGVTRVHALKVLSNGDLVAAGFFRNAGGQPASNIARWDGAAWHALGQGFNGAVQTLLTLPNGDLMAGGEFTASGELPMRRAARWDGTSWLAFGDGVPTDIESAIVLEDGRLMGAGREISWGMTAEAPLWIWEGTEWSYAGNGFFGTPVTFATALDGALYAGVMGFSWPSQHSVSGVYRRSGSSWTSIGDVEDYIWELLLMPNGDLVAGGNFDRIGGVPANNIARWDGSGWNPIGGGTDGTVEALALAPNGELLVGGSFTLAGGLPADRVARWDGSSWSAVGTGLPQGAVYALGVMPSGRIVAGGSFFGGAWIWNGATWSRLGLGVQGSVHTVLAGPSSGIVIGGSFSHGWFYIDGMTFSTDIGHVAMGDENMAPLSSWGSPTGSPRDGNWYGVNAIARQGPFLVAAGDFGTAANQPARGVAVWNGLNWSAPGGGLDRRGFSVVALPSGDIAVGGDFSTAGGFVSARFAQTSLRPAGVFADGPQEASMTTCQSLDLEVGVQLAGPFSYHWAHEAWRITEPVQATGPRTVTLNLNYPHLTYSAGDYYLCVTSPCGTYISHPIHLTILNHTDYNGDGDARTDADIEAFFACLAGNCCATCIGPDFNADGQPGTDADIESFFRVLAGGPC